MALKALNYLKDYPTSVTPAPAEAESSNVSQQKTPQINNSDKSVLLIAPQPFFANRGTPLNVYAMATALGEFGYKVDLLVYPLGEEIEIPGVRIIRSLRVPWIKNIPIGPSWRKIALDSFLFFTATRLIFTRNYSVIHGVEEGGFLAVLLGKLRGAPVIFDMDSFMPEQLAKSGFLRSNKLLRRICSLEKSCLKRAAAVLTVCSALSEKAKELAPNANVHQIEDFPIESAAEADLNLLNEFRDYFQLRCKRVVLYTGNFERYQGIDLLFAAFSQLLGTQDINDVVLVLVGGEGLDSPQTIHYRNLARKLGIASQVIFTGPRPQKEMGSFMALADVLVSPRIEGGNTPLKIYSYMASERVVVATNIISHTQVLDETNAYLALPEQAAFARALKRALEDREGARQIAKQAKELVDAKYSKQEFNRRLKKLYQEVVV